MSVRFKSLFFDHEKLKRHLGRKESRVLSRTGAYARTVMRNKIKKAPKKARSSSRYPRYHKNKDGGLRKVLFSYDPTKGSVIIGPRKFRQRGFYQLSDDSRRRTNPGGKTVPQMLNEGGVATQTTEYISGAVIRKQVNYRPSSFVDDTFKPATIFFRQLLKEIEL